MEDKKFKEQVFVALQALHDEVTNLKKEVAELKQDKANLEAENAKLKEQIRTFKANSVTPNRKTVFDGIEKTQREQIDSLNDLIKRKEAYINRLEHSLAKYNYREVQLLKRLE